jgi:hypothetical protein
MSEAIARGDMARLLAWVTATLADLESRGPKTFHHRTASGAKREVECSWHETYTRTPRAFPKRDRETGEIVTGPDGKPEYVRFVKLGKRGLTVQEQAEKLCNTFHRELAVWNNMAGRAVIARVIAHVRGEQMAQAIRTFETVTHGVAHEVVARAKVERAKEQARDRAETDKAAKLAGNWEVERLMQAWLG